MQLHEQDELMWNDGVAPETAIDFDLPSWSPMKGASAIKILMSLLRCRLYSWHGMYTVSYLHPLLPFPHPACRISVVAGRFWLLCERVRLCHLDCAPYQQALRVSRPAGKHADHRAGRVRTREVLTARPSCYGCDGGVFSGGVYLQGVRGQRARPPCSSRPVFQLGEGVHFSHLKY